LDSICQEIYQKVKQGNDSGASAAVAGQIFMVQHYVAEHGAYVQYIQNDSEDQVCYATSALKYKNML